MDDLVGRKVIGFRFESYGGRILFTEPMEKYVGSVGEVLHLGEDDTAFIVFPDESGFYYPIELVEKYLVSEGVEFLDSSIKNKDGSIEKLKENLLHRKVFVFRFEDDEDRMLFTDHMEKYIGRVGEIVDFGINDTVIVEFSDGNEFYYPIELAKEYLITEKVEDTKDNKGVKNNSKKLPMSKLKVQFPNALQAVVLCSSMGHEKYKDTDEDWLNFLRVPGGSETYRDAFERHSLYEVGDVDEESGLPHLFHELWNKMAEVEIWIRENHKEIT